MAGGGSTAGSRGGLFGASVWCCLEEGVGVEVGYEGQSPRRLAQ